MLPFVLLGCACAKTRVRGIPDLVAKKKDDILLVEVYTDDKKLIRQLNAYQEAGKVMLVLTVRDNIELWD